MRYLTVILLVFLVNFVCLGNKVNKNLVSKVESLGKELQESKDSISSLTKELAALKADLEKVKTNSDANDDAFLEYGSSIVGILVGIIILFGVVYYNSSKQAARDAFDDQFDNYSSSIKNKIAQAQTALDKLNSRVDIIDETEEEINTSSTKIENEFK